MSEAEAPGSARSRSTPIMIGLVVVLAVVAAAIAMAISGGGETARSSVASEGPLTAADLEGELGEITVDGDPLPRLADDGADPAEGLRPPSIAAVNPDGATHTISPDGGGPVMLVFLAHWCPHCNDEIPRLVQLRDEGRLPDDLEVYGVLTGMAPERPNYPPSEWIVDRGWPWPVIADGAEFTADAVAWQVADAFGVFGYPYVVVVDDGVVTSRWAGGSEIDALERQILLAVG